MSKDPISPNRNTKGGKLFPALCNLFGTLILVAIIAACLPVAVPRALGYEIYNVTSPSMEPEIPVGSVLYVKTVEPVELQEGDVIAFMSGAGVIAHRVVRNQTVEGELTTKGDANAGEDLNAVPYEAVVGRVKSHFPVVGNLLGFLSSTVGKIYVIIIAACGAMLNLIAGRLRDRRRASDEE